MIARVTSERSSLALASQMLMPLHGTSRTPSRPTLGPAVAKIAAALGKPFLPWQRYLSDIALEVDPETGFFAFNEINLVVPRQSGKTEWLLPYQAHRCSAWPNQRVLYTAQTFTDARKKWEDIHVARLDRSPLRSLYKVRRRTSAESIMWHNGSQQSPEATGGKSSGTGDSIDIGIIDEAWSKNDATVELGMRPAMLTRSVVPPGPQLVVSSMVPGPTRLRRTTSTSEYLREKIVAGRSRVEAGLNRDVAYFEWGAPVGADPGDPATWWAAMPAMGYLVREDTVRADFERMDLTDFCAEYLSWWPEEIPSRWLAIPEPAWTALFDPESRPIGPLRLAIDVNPSQTRAAVVIAGAGAETGTTHLETLDSQPGTGWTVEYVAERLRRNPDIREVVLIDRGPAGILLTELEKTIKDVARGLGVEPVGLRKVPYAEYGQACGRFLAGAIDQPRWRHRGQPDLDAAVAGAERKFAGKGWTWAHATGSTVDISPLVAVTLAAWAHETAPTGREPFAFYA